MPGLTPNFFLRYPLPADPADVPGALQALAEDVEGTLTQLAAEAQPRAMAQFLGTITNTIPGTALSGTFTWQLTDFNTYAPTVTEPMPAVQPINDASTTALTVNHDGFWFIFGTVQANTTAPAASIDELAVELLKNGSATPPWSRSGSHDTTTAGVSTFTLDVAAGMPLLAGDTVGLRGLVRRSAGSAAVSFGSRSITLLRMTLS